MAGCTRESKPDPAAQKLTPGEHKAAIKKWQKEREASLREPDSWLSLAGLYPLDQEMQTFGADSSNDMVFPAKAPAFIGRIARKDGLFQIYIEPDVKVRLDGEPIDSVTVDPEGEPVELTHRSLLWFIIERRGSYYVRLKDREHSNLSAFGGIDTFPIDSRWRIQARFKRFQQPRMITIPDILGESYQDTLHGLLEFRYEGKKYSLAPMGHPDRDEEFFLIFGDATNGDSTYGGGRYLYLATPDEEGLTYIDFNKAYNPPCVFTRFATCPLPPAQNRLPFKVMAGEKMYESQ